LRVTSRGLGDVYKRQGSVIAIILALNMVVDRIASFL
jgi:hypothetical protein